MVVLGHFGRQKCPRASYLRWNISASHIYTHSEPEAFFLFLDEIIGYSPDVAFALNSKSNKLGLELSCYNSVHIDGHYKLAYQCGPV